MIELTLDRLLVIFNKIANEGLEIYRHFKGPIYVVTGRSIDTETGKTHILYRKFNLEQRDLDHVIWSRPMGMFFENVQFTEEPRFKKITPVDAAKLLFKEYQTLINNSKQQS